MLKVYSKTVCPACMLLKNELKKANIAFEEVNIDKNPEGKEILVNAGIMGVPVVESISRILHQ